MYINLPTESNRPIIWLLSVEYPNKKTSQLGTYSTAKKAKKHYEVKNLQWHECKDNNGYISVSGRYKIEQYILDSNIEESLERAVIDITCSIYN